MLLRILSAVALSQAPTTAPEWTPEQLSSTFVDVKGFTRTLIRKSRNGDLVQAEARYVATDGTGVLAVGSFEVGLSAMRLEDAMPHGSDLTTKKPVKCSFETIEKTRVLSCSSYGAYFRSAQWNHREAMFTVAIANPSSVTPSRARELVDEVARQVVRASVSR